MRVLALTGQSDRPEAALLAGLAERGVEVEWRGDLACRHLDQLKRAGVTVGELPLPSRISPRAVALIRSRLKHGAFDLIHAFTGRALSNATIASWGLPPTGRISYRGTVGHLGALDPMSYLTWRNRSLSATVCVSDAVREYLLGCGIPSERLVTIYKGHELGWYQQPGGRERFSEFGIPSGAFVFICTANIRPVKGVDTLIEAFSQISARCPKAHLLLVGDLRVPALRTQALCSAAPTRIHFTGFRSDVTVLAGGADVMVLASKDREGLPKSVIEGMAQGVPAVVTRVGGMPELVEHGRSGLVVPPSDPKELGGALESLYHDPALRSRLGAGALERIASEFTVTKMIDATLALYKKLCAAPQPR